MTTQAPASTSASTRDPKCNCPLKDLKNCDVKKLVLKVTRNTKADPSSQSKIGFSFVGQFEDAKTRELTATRNLKRIQGAPEAAVKKLGKRKAALLTRYDLVIETTAQFAMGDKAPQNSVDIDVDATWEGKCVTNEHGLLAMRTLSAPVGAVKAVQGFLHPAITGRKGGMSVLVSPPPKIVGTEVALGQSISWPINTPHVKLKEVYGQPADFDLSKPSTSPLSMAIRMLRMAWAFLTPMDFEFTADTHGCLEDKSRIPNDNLLGLVRVYRETSIGVSIKFPPVSKTVEEKVQRGPQISEEKKKELYYLIGGEKTSSENGIRKMSEDQEYKPLAYELLLKINELELVLKERSTYEAADEAAKKKAALRGGARAAHDRAYMIAVLWHCGEWATAIKMVWEDLVKGLKAARQILTSFFDWTKRFPQLGWKLEYEMTLLAGTMGVKFGQGDGEIVLERYAALKWKGSFEMKLTVVEAKAKISFGIVVDFGPVGSVDIRVFGEIIGTVEAGLEKVFMNADPDDGEKVVKIAGTASGRLGAIAAVETFIYTWKREIFIQAGLRVAGSIKWEKDQTSYEVNFTRLPVVWQFIAKNSRSKEAVARVHTLCEERHILGYKDIVKAT